MGFGYTNIPSNGIEDNYSVRFDGTGDYAGSDAVTGKNGWFPTNIHLGATLAYWTKPTALSGGNNVLGCHNNKRWYLGTTSFAIKFGMSNVHDNGTENVMELNAWQHLAMVLNPDGTYKIYHNGQETPTNHGYTADNSGSYNPTGFTLGATYNGTGSTNQALTAKISDMVHYNTALTSEQIMTIYNGREPFDHNDWALSHELDVWYRCGDAKKGYLDNPIMIDSSKNTAITTLGGELDDTASLYGSQEGPNLILNGNFNFSAVGWVPVDFTFSSNKVQCLTDGAEQSFRTALPFIEPDGGVGHLFKLKYEVITNSDSIQIKTGGKTNDFCDEVDIPSTVGVHEIYIIGTNNGDSDEMTIFHAHGNSAKTLEMDNFELTLYKNGKQFVADAAFSNEGGG